MQKETTSGESDIEVDSQTPPPPEPPSIATHENSPPREQEQEDYKMGEEKDPADDEYPLRYYSDEVDTDPEDLDYEPESRPTSPMSLTESERGLPDFSDVIQDLHRYDTDPEIPPSPRIQGALALYTEKELEVLREAYEMIHGRPARWFREQTAEPAAPEKDDMVVVERAESEESAVLIDRDEASGEDWVNV